MVAGDRASCPSKKRSIRILRSEALPLKFVVRPAAEFKNVRRRGNDGLHIVDLLRRAIGHVSLPVAAPAQLG